MSISTASSYSLEPRASNHLYLVAWGNGNTAHWALYLPVRQGSPNGYLFHIGVNGTKCSKGNAKLEIRGFVITASGARRCIELRGAEVSFNQLKDAAEHVYAEYKYNIVTSNCQNFAVQILQRLNQIYPESVTPDAIQHAMSRGTISTYLARITNRSSPIYRMSSSEIPRNSQSERWTID